MPLQPRLACLWVALIGLGVLILTVACSSSSPAPTSTPTPSTPIATPTLAPAATPTLAPTSTPTLSTPTHVPSLGVTCAQVYQSLVASSVSWVPQGRLNRHTEDWHSTMTPNGAIMVDLFGPCTGLEAVEILFWQTAPPDQIIITRDIVVVAAMPDHAAEVGAWFDDALDRMGETGDLVQRERLSLIYLTMAYAERWKWFVFTMDVQPQQ